MVYTIARQARTIWQKWNLRSLIMISLSLQAFLITTAPLRKRTANIWVKILIWIAYLLADFVALFSLGLISDKQGDYTEYNLGCDLMAFWAPFCLLHLGGPDTITALSLQDNSLWLRHLIGLIFQVIISLYVFVESLPNNRLWLPISFLFVAGMIKYYERNHALYLANFYNFRGEAGPNYAKLMQEMSSFKSSRIPVQVQMVPRRKKESIITTSKGKNNNHEFIRLVRSAYYFFNIFKYLAIDELVLPMSDRNESRDYYHEIGSANAFKVLSAELNFFYGAVYTKALALHSQKGYFLRLTSTLAILVSFSLFLHNSTKHRFPIVDLWVTYILFAGAIALDAVAFVLMVSSDWTIVKLGNKLEDYPCLKKVFEWYLELNTPTLPNYTPKLSTEKESKTRRWAPKRVLFSRWSGLVRGCNLVEYSLREGALPELETIGMRDLLFNKFSQNLGLTKTIEKCLIVDKNDLTQELWEFIYRELKKKSIIVGGDIEMAKKISSARGDWILREQDQLHIHHHLIKTYVDEVDYAESLLLWHVATEICYNLDEKDSDKPEGYYRKFSKVLSDYMLYLLRFEPTLLSSVAGIGEVRFIDTCAEAKRFFVGQGLTKVEDKEKACERVIKVDTSVKPAWVKGTKSQSVLFDACRLGKELQKVESEKKWMLVFQVWVELLSYAACQCRAKPHLTLLGTGGELVTYVWLLMAHFGIGEHLYVTDQDHHAQAKLLLRM
ncbi:uncharacterized protein LOC133799600 [Humulus lupulus]|uniref:uncharacterized protein LOC133799600 n=1 Tax=Humulus lupulus TaxID=3486 RepID=UPI002B404580|nr:uncharacterized protein LOC133799600 [Humulus lupulus]